MMIFTSGSLVGRHINIGSKARDTGDLQDHCLYGPYALCWSFGPPTSAVGPQPKITWKTERQLPKFHGGHGPKMYETRGPKDHINTRILQSMIAGIYLTSVLETRMRDPYVHVYAYVVFWAPRDMLAHALASHDGCLAT